MVFVIDSSGSIRDQNPIDGSYDNWALLLNFAADLVDTLEVSQSQTRVGVVKYSTQAYNIFYLKDFDNKAEIRRALTSTSYIGGHTNTSGGIRLMYSEQFSSVNGDRPDVPNMAIVLTDGKSTKDANKTIPDAIEARKRGIMMFSVGITNAVNDNELKGISSDPQQEGVTYWKNPDFQTLNRIIEQIRTQICVTNRPTQPPPVTPGRLRFAPSRVCF